LLDYAQKKLGQNILLTVILKKQSNDKFNIPLQGKYLQDVSGLDTDYDNQEAGSANSENQIADNLKRS